MKAGVPRQPILIAAWLLLFLFWGAAVDGVADAARVAVVMSSKIRPYVEAAEGMLDTLQQDPQVLCDTHYLDKYADHQLAEFSKEIEAGAPDLLIAIGPGAARFAWSSFGTGGMPLLFAMVLNPRNVEGLTDRSCGVTLNIPVADQIHAIHRGQPAARRLGLLFDPANNRTLFDEARQAATALGLSVAALEVSSKREIPAVLEKNWSRIDALWLVPDRTVISESIVQYVIQESIYRKLPVIGYNRFFYESGAALAFVIDYREVGAQCGREASRILDGAACRQVPPVFQLLVNTRIMGKLGVAGPQDFSPPLKEGP